mgnify:FL=1
MASTVNLLIFIASLRGGNDSSWIPLEATMFFVIIVEDAICIVQFIPNVEEAAKKLTEEAFSRGSNDNITCMVVCFHDKGTTL